MGRYMEQFEAPEEIDQARLACLQRWTEKRLDTVVITRLGEERDLYKTLCELVLATGFRLLKELKNGLWEMSFHPKHLISLCVYRWFCAVTGRRYSPPQAAAVR